MQPGQLPLCVRLFTFSQTPMPNMKTKHEDQNGIQQNAIDCVTFNCYCCYYYINVIHEVSSIRDMSPQHLQHINCWSTTTTSTSTTTTSATTTRMTRRMTRRRRTRQGSKHNMSRALGTFFFFPFSFANYYIYLDYDRCQHRTPPPSLRSLPCPTDSFWNPVIPVDSGRFWGN